MDHIDLYQIHGTDTVTPIDETLRALDDLVSGGLVRYVGMSNWQAWRIAKALGVSERKGFARFETLQAYYSIAGRDLERDIVPLLTEEKMGLMVWSPLAGGLLSGKYGPGAPRKTARAAGQVSIFRRLTRTGPGLALPRCARLRRNTAPVLPKWRSCSFWPNPLSPALSSAPRRWSNWRKTLEGG